MLSISNTKNLGSLANGLGHMGEMHGQFPSSAAAFYIFVEVHERNLCPHDSS